MTISRSAGPFGRLLRSVGYAVDTFESAGDFLESLPGGRPDCLIQDIQRERMSGLDLQEGLATDGIDIPIIFITAHDDPLTRERITRSGVVESLRKPFEEQEWLDAIHWVA